MNRCLSLSSRGLWPALLLWLCASLWPLTVPAQAALRTPPIPNTAQRGVLLVTQPPQALLNGQPVRLSPGARIRGRDNLLVLSASLVGQELAVRFTRDPLGLLHEVWILTDAELQAAAPPILPSK